MVDGHQVPSPAPRGDGALALVAVLALLLGLLAALAPVATEKYRYGGDGALACVMGDDAPPGFDAYVDRVDGTFAYFPARVECRWDLPDGSEVRTLRPISTSSTVVSLVGCGLGLVGLVVVTVRRARRRGVVAVSQR
ncbi:hypothetical protein [Oerskovia flava]|uniref:hypothetical protein n=1 Tax=Oerskovia flava TaxID=2986422 RepID=UPI0022406C1E|nr:hypothetical protein [Oerskovia sp. JB1-3-2]